MDQLWRMQLANLRHELLAPALAIRTYAETLAEDARRHGPGSRLADLATIRDAGIELFELIEALLDTDADAPTRETNGGGDWKQRLRHSLRTPLTTLRGYSELVLGESAGDDGLADNLGRMMVEVSRLFAHLDTIVEFHLAPAMSAQLMRSMSAPADAGAGDPAPADILVVDDNDSNRELLARQLRQDGHRVGTAEDGTGTLNYLNRHAVDVVLLDLLMPGRDGFDVLSEIKRDGRFREVAVIVISALDAHESVIRCIDAGAEDYLPKPHDRYLLRARINGILRRKGWRAPPSASGRPAPRDAVPPARAHGANGSRDASLRREIERVLEAGADMLSRNKYLTSRSLARLLARSGEYRFKEPTLRKIVDRRYPPMQRLGLIA
jgi:DNA-binding response OmpR family regulator